MRIISIILFWGILFHPSLSAQEAFICKGDFYLVLSESSQYSVLYEANIDATTGNVNFDPSPNSTGQVVNAIGYRITDNLIYGIDLVNNKLLQIDATGTATVIGSPNLNPNQGYYGGAISPDGDFLVLISNEANSYVTNKFTFIDLNSPTFETTTTVLTQTTSGQTPSTSCTDIAFDPTSGILYGFDANSDRLSIFDFDNATIDDTTYPITTTADAMGALFFDAFGNLYGYGDIAGSNVAETFFGINKTTGQITALASGPIATNKDGYSCPFTIQLEKIVFPEVAFPCTEVLYTFKLANSSGILQNGIDFEDHLPDGFTITEFVHNPYNGNMLSGLGTNLLSISNMTIPVGIDSIVIKVEVPEFAEGIYKNQASLFNIPSELGNNVLSDNPNTLAPLDSTPIEIIPLFLDLPNQTITLCHGDTITINTSLTGVDYLWNDGSTNPFITISEEGIYTLEVSTDCETLYDTLYVEALNDNLFLDLGGDEQIELGDIIQLDPTTNMQNVFSYTWEENSGSSMSCTDCENPFVRPINNTTYTLTISDEFLCSISDEISFFVDKSRRIYVATAFSPNFDGTNDLFFIQGKPGTKVLYFSVYNRWGAVLFESQNFEVNDMDHAWDGTFHGQMMNSGVYVWYAELEYLDSEIEVIKGDVTLMN